MSQVAASCPGRPSQASRTLAPGAKGVRTGGHRQQRSDLVHLQRRRTGPGGIGHSCAQPHQPAGLQADLGENLDAVDGVGAARDDDIGLTARARLRGHLMEDLADVGGEG